MPDHGGRFMIKSCDVGSLPSVFDEKKFLEGAKRFELYPVDDSIIFFEKTVFESFNDKIMANMDVPNYPQFRDMNEMFLTMIGGIERGKEGYLETEILSIKANRSHIPEVEVIKKQYQRIYEKHGPFEIKICVTGPYTLSSQFHYRDKEMFIRLGKPIFQIIENNIFSKKHCNVSLVEVDEPVFGLLDDPLIDFGSEGRENLRKTWESIFHKARSKNTKTLLHLHNTGDDLFWDVKSLDIIDSHVNDSIYEMKRTKKRLELSDKFLKASIAIADFDSLIKKHIITNSRIEMTELDINRISAKVWTDINNRKIDPKIFLESFETMKKRLIGIVSHFGIERVPYAGPECGLKSIPTYECALECLRRVSKVVKSMAR